MKIYLAARYSRHEEMRGIREELEKLGHAVTSRWIEAPEGKYGRGSFTPQQLNDDPGYCSAVAVRDMEDIIAADWVISFTEPGGGGKGGRHVELGIAIGLRKVLFICGPRENVFHTAPGIGWFPGWAHLARQLESQDQEKRTGDRDRRIDADMYVHGFSGETLRAPGEAR